MPAQLSTDDAVVMKSFCTFEIKDAEKGEVEALFCTIGVVDKDEDIVRPGAIVDGQKVSMSDYGHSAVFGDAPVGKGKILIDGDKAVFKGRIFLNTARGRETFETLKEMGADQEWSWGFRVLGAEVPTDEERKQGARRAITKTDTFEVSPVICGAGVGTRTLGVKTVGVTVGTSPLSAEDASRIGEQIKEQISEKLGLAKPAEVVTPPDPAIEAKRLADEQAEAERRTAEMKKAALDTEGDRRFRNPPAGIKALR